ncbi:MAG TPA: hypothetical protein VFC78_22170 [Tepidisphaeraceae bacterium]|nr:hypothetical protein [Tepidisphaeraceae bacterium]
MARSPSPRCQLPRLLLGASVAILWAVAPSAWSADPAAAAPVISALRPDRLFDALASADRRAPADQYDPAAVVALAGRDPVALLAWVRDHTAWAPYQGALRGPTGVLLDRVGSSLDRSLLLAELLRSAGFQSRLAYAQLPPAITGQLMAKIGPMPSLAAPPPRAMDAAESDLIAKEVGIPAQALRQAADGPAAEADTMREDIVQQFAQAAPALAAAVGDFKPPSDDSAKQQRTDALADHWWVQVNQGGKWVDLDPLVPDAKAGPTFVAAEKTYLPAQLPADQWHRIIVRVVIEKTDGKKLSLATVYSGAFAPAAVIGKPIVLSQMPLSWPGDVKDMAGWKAAALKQHEWMPQLDIGDANFYTSSFDDSGNVNDSPQPNNPLAVVGGAVGGAAGAFGALGGDDAPRTTLTAEWLEYEIRGPGRTPQTIRREILDFLGPAARAKGTIPPAVPWTDAQRLEAGGRFADHVEILPQVCRIPASFVSHLMAQAVLADRQPFLEYLARTKPSADNTPPKGLKPLPSVLYSLAFLRDDLGDRAGSAFYDHPNILTHHTFLARSAGGEFAVRAGFDIVCNDIAVRPIVAANPSRVRLEHGVDDTVIENVLAADGARPDNAAAAFAEDLGAGHKWLTVRSARDPAWRQAAVSPDARARIEQDLANGFIVVVSASAPANGTAAWWRIDPATGQILGMAGPGWGTAMVEYEVVAGHAMSTLLCIMQYKSVGGRILCIAGSTLGGVMALSSQLDRDMVLYIIALDLAHGSNAFG